MGSAGLKQFTSVGHSRRIWPGAMLAWLRCSGPDCALSRAEKASLTRVAEAHRHLVRVNELMGAESAESRNACAALLNALPAAATALKADVAPRAYRKSYAKSYQVMFPVEGRRYRVEILKACMRRHTVISVNGDTFHFSTEAVFLAKTLQEAWVALVSVLERCSRSQGLQNRCVWLPRAVIRDVFSAVDLAWALFEQVYISELMEIEVEARHLIVKAVEQEAKLQELEDSHKGEKSEPLHKCPAFRMEVEKLAWWISRLNSVSNIYRKGRDDLDVGVVCDALATLHCCDTAEKAGKSTEATEAARILAIDIIESFNQMRRYLRNVATCLELVDPQLSNNAGLVQCLVDWEVKWELGSRYIQNPGVLDSLCNLVAYIQQVQRSVPAFAAKFKNFDPELFMILPRLVWLQFLKAPEQHSELLRIMLPVSAGDEEFDAFREKFRSARRELTAVVQHPRGTSAEVAAWDLITRRAVFGTVGSWAPEAVLPRQGGPACAALQELAHLLEPWSIRLQRHRPDAWNQCVALVAECLERSSAIERGPKALKGRQLLRI